METSFRAYFMGKWVPQRRVNHPCVHATHVRNEGARLRTHTQRRTTVTSRFCPGAFCPFIIEPPLPPGARTKQNPLLTAHPPRRDLARAPPPPQSAAAATPSHWATCST